MEKVFPVLSELSAKGTVRDIPISRLTGSAVIEKVIGPGKYIVTIKDGTRLTALGPEELLKGTKVQIAPVPQKALANTKVQATVQPPLKGDQWLAKFPMRFASGASEVKLELYVEGDKPGLFGKKDPVVHLVFSVKTATLGQIQWSVYLRKNQVLTQVYFEKVAIGNPETGRIIQEFEESLKKKGFSLLAPTVILKRPFKVSAGLQLNIQG